MSKAIYIAITEPNSGKSIVSLGLMQMLLWKAAKVGCFRPIMDGYPTVKDNHTNTLISYFNLQMQYEEAFAFTRSEVIHKNYKINKEEVLDIIMEKYKMTRTTQRVLYLRGILWKNP